MRDGMIQSVRCDSLRPRILGLMHPKVALWHDNDKDSSLHEMREICYSMSIGYCMYFNCGIVHAKQSQVPACCMIELAKYRRLS